MTRRARVEADLHRLIRSSIQHPIDREGAELCLQQIKQANVTLKTLQAIRELVNISALAAARRADAR